jgi:hypothetical protein
LGNSIKVPRDKSGVAMPKTYTIFEALFKKKNTEITNKELSKMGKEITTNYKC